MLHCDVVTAADLTAVTLGNTLCKYADDTYAIIPASNVDSRAAELDNVTAWSSANNLTLNRSSYACINGDITVVLVIKPQLKCYNGSVSCIWC